jgi:protein involved in polysaccharide export with SLBB domain
MTLEDLIREAGGFEAEANEASMRIFRLAAQDRLGRKSTQRYPIVPAAGPASVVPSPRLIAWDSVFVPPRIGCVRIRGEVSNPGFYPYVEGKSAAFYVDAAGGFLPRADRERIGLFDRISGITGTHSPGVEVHDGDEVIVSIREELK